MQQLHLLDIDYTPIGRVVDLLKKYQKSNVKEQRNDELSDILAGLQSLDLQLELISSPPQIPIKSPQDRRNYRQSQFSKYFRDSCLYNINLSNIAVQPPRNLSGESLICRLVALRDKEGTDVAIGVITDWQKDDNVVVVKAPPLQIQQIRCLVIGDITIDISDE